MKQLSFLAAFVVLASLACLAASSSFTIPVKQYKLKNGLTVILSEDHAAPTLAVAVCYNVGRRDEQPGQSGFAHYFEHMMFSGSENVPPELARVIGSFGNSANTTAERTFFWSTIPANLLDLVLFREADRMHSLILSDDGMETQRANIKEELMSYRPDGQAYAALYDTAYDAFPYKHIGSQSDMDAANLEAFRAFHEKYYFPGNATLIIVGDFKGDEALAKARKYFDQIPRKPPPSGPDIAEAPQTSERRKTIEDNSARLPRIDIGYKIPPGNSPEWYSAAVLSRILGEGDSSRLRQKLIRDTQMASEVSAETSRLRGPSLTHIVSSPRSRQNLAEVEMAVYGEIARLQTEPVADWELERVRTAARWQQVKQNESFLDRAFNLAEDAVVLGDANLINTESQKLANVTKEDVIRAARRYFTDANRTVIITVPKAK